MAINIGLSDKSRKGVVAILTTLLADEYILYTKTRNYHWNVTGPTFHDLHEFFEAQYDEVDGFIDDIAERIRSLGHPSPGTLAEFVKSTRLVEAPGVVAEADAMLADLHADHESLVRWLRADLSTCQDKFGDAGTSDFLTGIMERHEKMAWMLRSSL